jgi:hypothetical protein
LQIDEAIFGLYGITDTVDKQRILNNSPLIEEDIVENINEERVD